LKPVLGRFGAVDILVNNAGIQHVAPVEEFPVDKWNAIIALNLSAAFHTTRLALPAMKKKGWGRIVNIASAHALVASPFKAAYVIGVGQAAPALCARLDKEGLKTALIERKLLSGTCVNNSCIPTKTLIASARAAHVARRGSDYGFSAGSVRVDMPAVKQRKDTVVKQSSDRLERWIAGMRNVSLVRGHAAFTAPRTVSGGSRLLQADRIFLD